MSLGIFIRLLYSNVTIVTFKNSVQKNRDGDFIFCPRVFNYRTLTLLIMTKMLIYFVLPLGVSFSRNRQLKTSNFEKNVMFPDTDRQIFKKILTSIHMTHVNFLFHRLLVRHTQTDRQTDREKGRQSQRDRDRQREIERQRERERHRETERERILE